jgi:hypothetical protein
MNITITSSNHDKSVTVFSKIDLSSVKVMKDNSGIMYGETSLKRDEKIALKLDLHKIDLYRQ